MTRPFAFAPLIVLLALPMPAADAGNMSGKWRLNIDKSDWGKKARPQNVEIDIQHSEPNLKYSGSVTDASGLATKFEFDGAIDNKEYKLKDDNAFRTISIKRISPFTTTAAIKSPDGRNTETTTTVLSRDGKTLTRNIILKTPEGTTRWTEVYDKVD